MCCTNAGLRGGDASLITVYIDAGDSYGPIDIYTLGVGTRQVLVKTSSHVPSDRKLVGRIEKMCHWRNGLTTGTGTTTIS